MDDRHNPSGQKPPKSSYPGQKPPLGPIPLYTFLPSLKLVSQGGGTFVLG